MQGQPFFNYPNTPDYGSPNFQSNVKNTGTENGMRYNGTSALDYAQVYVWDGDEPSWMFIEENSQGSPTLFGPYKIGTQAIIAQDPDIIFNHSTGTDVMIVYHADVAGASNIYFELWDVSGTPTRTIGPTLLSNTRSGRETHANIDVGINGRGAIVWQDHSSGHRNVHVKTFEFTPTLSISANEENLVNAPFSPAMLEYYEPDVAVNDFETESVVHMAFNSIDQQSPNLYTYSHGISWNSLHFSNTYNGFYTTNWQSHGTSTFLHPPRISGGYHHINDHAVTFGSYVPLAEHYIELGVRDYNVVTTNTFTAGTPINMWPVSLLLEPNLRPAISYIGDIIMVAWTYNDILSPPHARGHEEILVKQYYPDGTPLSSTLDYYALLIDQNSAGCNTVSVAGRYNSRGSYFAWHQLDGPEVLFKNADWQNLQLRKANPNTEYFAQLSSKQKLLPYPNPFKEFLALGEGNSPVAMEVQIHEVSGRLVYQRRLGKDDAKQIDLSHLPAAVYTLTIQTEGAVNRHKIVKH